MELEEFRREAHRLVDWMADYLAQVERYPVRAQVRPGEIAAQLPAAPPSAAEAFADIMADFERIVLPGMTHWQHPSFFAYFPANASPPSLLAEMLTATLAAQCMLWQTSPAATEMETRVLDWLRRMIGLPEGFTGVIQDTASSATLCAILCARERATGLARFVITLASSPLQTAAEQWFERTLDDSSNKRLSIPEAFLALDGCLQIVINVARGLVVYPKTIENAVMAELPFMATEEILMAAVRAGGDRQELHELIRRHSQEAAQGVKLEAGDVLLLRTGWLPWFRALSPDEQEGLRGRLNPGEDGIDMPGVVRCDHVRRERKLECLTDQTE